MGINPGGPWAIIAVLLTALGVGKWVGDAVGKLSRRVLEKRRAEREDQEADQSNSNYWQGQTMTLQGELAKRDEKIAQLQEQQKAMQLQLTEIQAQFAGVLWENRAYRDKYGPLNSLRNEKP